MEAGSCITAAINLHNKEYSKPLRSDMAGGVSFTINLCAVIWCQALLWHNIRHAVTVKISAVRTDIYRV